MSSAGTIDSMHGKEAWNKFVTTGECVPAVAPLIAQSWARCRALGHDPKRGPAVVVVEREELERRVARNRDLLTVAVPILDELQALVKDLGFLTLLTDSDGVILEMLPGGKLRDAGTGGKPASRWNVGGRTSGNRGDRTCPPAWSAGSGRWLRTLL